MLNDVVDKMAAHGDGAIPVDELIEDYGSKVTLWINNDVRPGTITYRTLALILENVGDFLRVNNMKLTQFLILDAVHGMRQLLLGNLFRYQDVNRANVTLKLDLERRINVTSSMYIGKAGRFPLGTL